MIEGGERLDLPKLRTQRGIARLRELRDQSLDASKRREPPRRQRGDAEKYRDFEPAHVDPPAAVSPPATHACA
jgi:hypothetical protein